MSGPSAKERPRGWLDRNILGLGLASLFSDWNHEMATAVLPAFLTGVLGAPAFALGLIEGVADGISTIFRLAAGWGSDRLGRRKGLAMLGYVLTSFSKAAFAFATTWPQVLGGRTAGWIGRAIRSPVRDSLLAESTEPATVGRAFAFHRTLDTVGAILGPLTATLLVAHVSLRTIFLVSLLPGLAAVLAMGLMVREKPREPDRRHPWHSLRELPRGFRRFLAPVGLFGIANFAPTLLILRAQDLLASLHGAAAASGIAIGLYTFSNAVYALVAYPVGMLADRIDKRAILAAGFALFGVVYAGFAAAGSQLAALALLFALAGIGLAIVEAVQPALASQLIHEHQHSVGFGAMSAVDGLGDFLSSTAMGALWTLLSPATGFLAACALALLAALLLARLRFDPAALQDGETTLPPKTCA